MKIPKIAKIAIIVFVVAILAIFAVSGLIAADVMSNFATGSEKLTPFGNPTEKALVVYNPGISGAAKDVAMKIAGGLQSRGFEVTLAGIKSAAAANVSGYGVIVVGGPIYGGKASSSVQSYLQALAPPENAKVGAFATGSYFKDDTKQPFPAVVSLKAVVLLFQGDNVDKNCNDFVTALLQ